MYTTFQCGCGRVLSVENRHFGKTVQCPSCRAIHQVSSQTGSIPEPSPISGGFPWALPLVAVASISGLALLGLVVWIVFSLSPTTTSSNSTPNSGDSEARLASNRTNISISTTWRGSITTESHTPDINAKKPVGLVYPKEIPPVTTDNKNSLGQRYRKQFTLKASSEWSGWPIAKALDGDLETSWFSAHGDAAALGKTPWIEATFPSDVEVRQVTILGNREPAWLIGYTILEGRLTMYDEAGKEIHRVENAGTGNLRDFDFQFAPAIRGVRAVRFTSLKDQGDHTVHKDIAIAEFQID